MTESINKLLQKRNCTLWELTANSLKYGRESKIQIYNYWYARAKSIIDSFMKTYPVETDDTRVNEVMSFHENWCQMVEIKATPTLYINGCKLPNW